MQSGGLHKSIDCKPWTWIKCIGISATIYRTQNPEKSQKSLPRGVRDPWPRTPQKAPKKVRKVKKIVDFDCFLDFLDFFWNFLGGPGSGVPNSSRETFLRLFGVSGFWVLLTSVDGRGDPKKCRRIPSRKIQFWSHSSSFLALLWSFLS